MAERLSKIFFEELNREFEGPSKNMSALKGPNRDWSMAYIGRNIMSVVEVDSLQDEIELLLNRLGVESKNFLFSVLSIDELLIGLKFYLISWSTMKDVMARLVNTSLDLGIDEKDISFGMILRNRKVKETKIPEICKKYAKSIDIGRTDKARNEAVHRGKLSDEDVSELKNKRNRIQSERFSLLQIKRISEDHYKKKMNEFYNELSAMVSRKKAEYSKHYEETISLNKEISIELAKIVAKNLNDEKI